MFVYFCMDFYCQQKHWSRLSKFVQPQRNAQKSYSADDSPNEIGVYLNRRSKIFTLAVDIAKKKKIWARPRIPASRFKTKLFVVEDIFRQQWRKNASELFRTVQTLIFRLEFLNISWIFFCIFLLILFAKIPNGIHLCEINHQVTLWMLCCSVILVGFLCLNFRIQFLVIVIITLNFKVRHLLMYNQCVCFQPV